MNIQFWMKILKNRIKCYCDGLFLNSVRFLMNGYKVTVFSNMKNNENSNFFSKKRCIIFVIVLMISQAGFSVLPRLTGSALQKFGRKISSTVLSAALLSKIAGTFKIDQSSDSILESSAQLADSAIMAVTDVSDIAFSVADAAAGVSADMIAPMGIGVGVAIYRYKKKQKKQLLLESSEPQTVYDLRNLHDDKKYHQTSEWKYYLAWIGCLAMYKAYKVYKTCQDNSLTVWLSSMDVNPAFQKTGEDGQLEYYVRFKSESDHDRRKVETCSKDLKNKKIQDFTLVANSQPYASSESDIHKAAFDFLDRKRKSKHVAWNKPGSDSSQAFNVDAKKHGWFKCMAHEDDSNQYFMCTQHRPGYFEHMSNKQILNTFWMMKNKIK